MKRWGMTVVVLAAASMGACGSVGGVTTAPPAPKVGDSVDFAQVATKGSSTVMDMKTSHMSVTLPQMGTMEADVDYSASPAKMSMTMTAQGQEAKFIYVDKIAYMGGSALEAKVGAGKWLKVDPNGTDFFSKAMAPQLKAMESSTTNPIQSLAKQAGINGKVVDVKDGLTTYEVTMTKEQLSAAGKAAELGIGEKAMASLTGDVTYRYTLTSEGLPTTIVTTVEGADVTMTFSRWGEPVSIVAPPEADIVSSSTLG